MEAMGWRFGHNRRTLKCLRPGCCRRFLVAPHSLVCQMAEDWKRLQHTYLPGRDPRPPPHRHRTKRVGRQVPLKAVLRLKEVFKNDYVVMDMLVDRGKLDAHYVRAMKAKTNYSY